jgi:hypothetical protein
MITADEDFINATSRSAIVMPKRGMIIRDDITIPVNEPIKSRA